MNKIFRVIYSTALDCCVVVSELGKAKKKNKTIKSVVTAGLLSIMPALAWGVSNNCNSVTNICVLGPWAPESNNNGQGAAIIDNGGSYTLNSPSQLNTAGGYYVIYYSFSKLQKDGYFVDSSVQLPQQGAEKLDFGLQKNVTVKDPITGNDKTISVYDSSAMRMLSSDVISPSVGAATSNTTDVYYDTNFANVTSGNLNINFSSSPQLTLGSMKATDLIVIDGTTNNSSAIWSSSNSISTTQVPIYSQNQTATVTSTNTVCRAIYCF